MGQKYVLLKRCAARPSICLVTAGGGQFHGDLLPNASGALLDVLQCRLEVRAVRIEKHGDQSGARRRLAPMYHFA